MQVQKMQLIQQTKNQLQATKSGDENAGLRNQLQVAPAKRGRGRPPKDKSLLAAKQKPAAANKMAKGVKDW